MQDEGLQRLIAGRVKRKADGKKLVGIATASCAFGLVIGFAVAFGIVTSPEDTITSDDLAKLAALAACSTGEPASAVYLKAEKKAGSVWPATYNEIAKKLLVDIDLDRCRIRQASDRDRNERVVRAFPPSDSYN